MDGLITKRLTRVSFPVDPNKKIKIFFNSFHVCCCCSCCSAYLSSCHWTASDTNLLDYPHTFHYQDYFVIGGIRTCLEIYKDLMFLWISSNSSPLNLLLVRSHQAKIIIVKRLIQEHNNVTRVWVESRSFDQDCRKKDTFTHSPHYQLGKEYLALCKKIVSA